MKIIRRLTHALTALAFCISLTLPAGIVHAGTGGSTTKTWSGGGDGTSFSDPLNWVNGVAPVTGDSLVFDTGTFDFSSVTLNDDDTAGTVFGGITVQGTGGAGVTISGNSIILGSQVNISGANNDLYLNLAITLGGAVTVSDGGSYFMAQSTVDNAGYDITVASGSAGFSGVVSGAGGFAVQDGATLELDADNTFDGNITVASGGRLNTYTEDASANYQAFGSTTGTTTIAPGGMLHMCVYDNSPTIAEPITIGGSGMTDTGPQWIQTTAAFAVDHCAYMRGGGGYQYGTTNVTFTGTVSLSADTAIFGEPNLYGNKIIFNNLVTNGYNVTQPNGSAAQLEYGGTTYPLPPVRVLTSIPSGDSSFLSVPARTDFQISSNTDSTGLDVTRAGLFEGTGTYADVTVEDNGTLTAGAATPAPGCMTVTSLDVSGALNENLQGKTTACTDFSQITVNGTVTLGSTATLNLNLLASYVPQVGDSFEIISNDGTDPVSGTFNGLPEGATFGDASNSYNFTISYVGGDGNDVVVTRAAGAPNTGFKSHRVQLLAGYGAVALVAGAVFVGSRRVLRKTSRG